MPSSGRRASGSSQKAVLSRRKAWLLTWAAFTVLGILDFQYRYLDDLARNRWGTFGMRLFEEMTGVYCALLLFPFVIRAIRHFRISRTNWWRTVPVNIGVMVAFSVCDTTLMAITRAVLAPIFGLGKYDYGVMLYRYPMEFANHVIPFWAVVAGVYFFDFYRESRDREVKNAELETRVAEAQLQNLRLQLQPHFLFNALNTISSVMHEDVDRADHMLAQLSDLLRQTSRTATSQEIPLKEELALLSSYIAIMEERFGDSLRVEFAVDPRVSSALVPQLILQPVVENAIRHARVQPRLDVSVRASQQDGRLILQVADNGPGIPDLAASGLQKGVGLSNTEERLEGLYGKNHQFTLENVGGLLVTVSFPLRMASAA